MSPFVPQRLASMRPRQIAAITLHQGNRTLPAGELFDVTGSPGGRIVIQSDSELLDNIGMGMADGELMVEGQAGGYLGRGMSGGFLQVAGATGIFAGSAMSGGRILIEGNAGDLLGGAAAGERQGMRGGFLHVRGSAGDRAGDRQRRGIIVVEGNAGDYAASRMVAGTLIILGQAGHQCGLDMRRGSLILNSKPKSLPATFNVSGGHQLTFLTLLNQYLESHSAPWAFPGNSRIRRWVGDLACDGRGEILIQA